MSTAQKFIILPFKKSRAGIVPADMRQASNAASAERIAASMSSRFVGVVALAAMANDETGELSGARLLSSHGETGDLSSMVEFSPEEKAAPVGAEEVTPADQVAPAEISVSTANDQTAGYRNDCGLIAHPHRAACAHQREARTI